MLPLRVKEGSVVLLQLGAMLMSMVHAPTDCKGQGSCFWSGINAGRHTVESHRRGVKAPTHTLPRHQQNNSLDNQPSKTTLKNSDKDAEVFFFFTIDDF